MKCLGKVIACQKTLQLIRKSLTAGYIDPETGEMVRTTEGTPQGSVLSPLLANIVLDVLDHKIEDIKKRFEKGEKRARNQEYNRIQSKIQWLKKSSPGSPEIKKLAVLRRRLPASDMFDPNFKRLMYLRYADDFVILVTGTYDDALRIKLEVANILKRSCGLELNHEKTVITATKDGFKFLGAHCIRVSAVKAGLSKSKKGNPAKYRLRMRVEIPVKDLLERLKIHKYVKVNPKGVYMATARKDLVNFSHAEIVAFYNHRIQGLTTFYSFASNYPSLRRIISLLQLSCALTLALKLKVRTMKAVFNEFGTTLRDPDTDVELKLPKTLKPIHKFSNVEMQKKTQSKTLKSHD